MKLRYVGNKAILSVVHCVEKASYRFNSTTWMGFVQGSWRVVGMTVPPLVVEFEYDSPIDRRLAQLAVAGVAPNGGTKVPLIDFAEVFLEGDWELEESE